MKIVLIGGHITPLLAVLAELDRPGNTITVITRKHSTEGKKTLSAEARLLPANTVAIKYITAGRLQRHFSVYTIPSLLKVPIGFIQALWFIAQAQPNVVVGFGGYLSVPVGVAAWCFRVPVVIHEQSVRAGLANRLLSRIAKTILLSWQSSEPYFPAKKSRVVGNPIRSALFLKQPLPTELAPLFETTNRPLIYITGGNQGSHAINQAVLPIVPKLLESYRILHQTGTANEADYTAAQTIANNLPEHYKRLYCAVPFLSDPGALGAVLSAASLVVGRSGANTVTELAAFGTPALLIPLPFAQQNEQTENAKLLVQAGTAEMLPQSRLSERTLLLAIKAMLTNQADYEKNASQAKALYNPNAAKAIAAAIIAAV